MSAPLQEQSGAKGHIVGRTKTGLVSVVSTEAFFTRHSHRLGGKEAHD
jgi:hypothetical protein